MLLFFRQNCINPARNIALFFYIQMIITLYMIRNLSDILLF